MRPWLQMKLLVDCVRETSRPVTARVGSNDGLDGRLTDEGWVVTGIVYDIVSIIHSRKLDLDMRWNQGPIFAVP
jgi:hypothetical protein